MENKFAIFGLIAFTLLAGCGQDNSTQMVVYVHDSEGNIVADAQVSAFKDYTLSVGPDRWNKIDGTIESTSQTGTDGFAYFELLPGDYSFKAVSPDGQFGGTASVMSKNGKRVDITVSKPQSNDGYAVFKLVNPNNSDFVIGSRKVTLSFANCEGSECNLGTPYEINSEKIEFPLKSGKWVFEFKSPGFSAKKITFGILENEAKNFDVVMEKA